MAPAIVHFLVGAAIVLFIATPFAFRFNTERNWALWLVPLGGVWGLLPDFHHVAPIGAEWLYAKHTSPWVDLMGLHYTLDRPTIRGLYQESIFAAILVFLVAVSIYSVSASLQMRGIRARTIREKRLASSLAFVVATGYAGFAAGVLLSAMAKLEAISLLAGGQGLVQAGLLLVPLSVLGGIVVWGIMHVVGDARQRNLPIAGGLTGFLIGVPLGAVGVTLLVPLWLREFTRVPVSIPMTDWGALLAVVVFSGTFGAMYATVRGAFESPSSPVRHT